jgi:hypothetical protein
MHSRKQDKPEHINSHNNIFHARHAGFAKILAATAPAAVRRLEEKAQVANSIIHRLLEPSNARQSIRNARRAKASALNALAAIPAAKLRTKITSHNDLFFLMLSNGLGMHLPFEYCSSALVELAVMGYCAQEGGHEAR